MWNIEEREKNSYVVSFFRLFLVLTSFISSHPKKSLEWFSRWRNCGILTMLLSPSLLISTTLNGSPQRTPEPSREWTFPESIINEPTAPTVSIINLLVFNRSWPKNFSMYYWGEDFWSKGHYLTPILVEKVSIAILSTTLRRNSNAKHGDFFSFFIFSQIGINYCLDSPQAPVLFVVSALLANVPSVPSLLLPKHPSKSTLYLRASTSTLP